MSRFFNETRAVASHMLDLSLAQNLKPHKDKSEDNDDDSEFGASI